MREVPPLLLIVDPGARGCGAALFHHGALVRAEYLAYIHTKDPYPHGDGAADRWACAQRVLSWAAVHFPNDGSCGSWLRVRGVLLVEEMKVYAGSKAAGDPDDLLRLQAVGYACVGAFASLGWQVESVRAGEWNGNLPRDIRMNRTRAWLEARGEADRVVPPVREPRLVHNAWSACGIGRWRIDPKAR